MMQLQRRLFQQRRGYSLGMLLLVCLLSGIQLFAIPAQHSNAASGISPIFTDDVLSTFVYKINNVPQPGSPSLSFIPVSGQPFGQALEVTTPGDIASSPYGNGQYSVTIAAPIANGVTQGDVLEATFYARQVAQANGGAQATFVFEQAGGAYTKSVLRGIAPPSEWKQYHYLFKVADTYSAGQAQVSFWLGYGSQTLDIGGFSVTDLGPDATIPANTYEGREANAPWRAEAAQRIEQYRKGDLSVKVVDAHGSPVPNANVHLKMLNHDFHFGTAVSAARINDQATMGDDQTYREKLVQTFNHAVFENDLKWSGWEDVNWRMTQTLPALQWLHDNGIEVRGHNLVWPGWWAWPPSDTTSLQNNSPALHNRIINHIANEVQTLHGQITDWDVINELYGAHDWVDQLGGNDEIVKWFQTAHQADPKAELALNDGGYFLGGSDLDVHFNTFYKNLIGYMKTHNAPIDRLGLESHMDENMLPSPASVMNMLDEISSWGVKPQITEFDLTTTDQQLQADYTRDYLTAAFSNLNVDTFMTWGFWDGAVWLPNTGFYANDWSLKPNGQVWMDLLYHQWWTDVTGTTGANGKYSNRSFLGDYQVDVTVNGKTNTVYTHLTNDGKKLVVKFDPNAPTPPAPVSRPTPPLAPVAGLVLPDRGGSLMNNGDIESGTSSWYCFGGCGFAQDSSTAHGGNNSLAITGRNFSWQGPAENFTGVLNNGNTYQSSVWAKLAAGETPATVDVNLKLTLQNGDTLGFPFGSALVSPDGWTQITGSAQVQWAGGLANAEWFVSTMSSGSTASFSIDDAQLQTSSSSRTVIARHVTTLDGHIEGSLLQLSPENLTLNRGALVTNGIYVTGEPLIQSSGTAIVSTELPSNGNANPTDKIITLNNGSRNDYVISRTDPVEPAPVVAPPTPTGTVDVTLTRPGQTVANFSTLRNLKINSNVGEIAVPPGTYGQFTVNQGNTLTLGITGASTPAIYNVQSLTLNGKTSKLKIVGPVILNLAQGSDVSATLGNSEHPLWLTINIAEGDMLVNSGASVYGVVNAPNSSITLNNGALVVGQIITDRITINRNGIVRAA